MDEDGWQYAAPTASSISYINSEGVEDEHKVGTSGYDAAAQRYRELRAAAPAPELEPVISEPGIPEPVSAAAEVAEVEADESGVFGRWRDALPQLQGVRGRRAERRALLDAEEAELAGKAEVPKVEEAIAPVKVEASKPLSAVQQERLGLLSRLLARRDEEEVEAAAKGE